MNSDVTWYPFDPQDPGSTPPVLDGSGAVAVVPAGDAVWAAEAAVGLARVLARSGRRVFLCDAHVEEPRLHAAFGSELGEGVSDLVLYGASPRRVAREVEDRLLFVAAGTTVADAGRVRSSPRWDALVDAVAQAEGVLLLHLPATGEGVDALLARAEHVIVAGDPAALPELGEARDRLVAGLHPPVPAPPSAAAPGVPGPTEPGSEAVHALPGEVPEAHGSRAGAPRVHVAPGTEVETPTTPEGGVLDDPRVREAVARARSGTPPAEAKSGGSRTLLLLALLVVLLVLAAAWFGFISIPGITPAEAGTVDPTPVAERPADATPPDPDPASAQEEVRVTAPHHEWNLTLGSYTDPRSADGLAARLGNLHDGLAVVVAPVEVGGTVYHRVLAGPMPDSMAAAALRVLLAGERGGRGDWVVRYAPFAFMVGEVEERAAAERRRAVLEDLGVPAYVMELDRSDGSSFYRVYVGAYADAVEASWMAARLADRNVDTAPLAERRGTPPA